MHLSLVFLDVPPDVVDDGVKENFRKGDKHVGEVPHVKHFDVRCLG